MSRSIRSLLASALSSALVSVPAALLLTAAHAQAPADWPSKPVTLIVPSSPGGGTDAYGRLLAQALTEHLKQTFVVENKPGASGAIGATAVAQAAGDGYTLLVASNSSLGINPALLKNLGYDVQRDFTPVTRGVIAPMVIAAHPGANVKTLRELIERGRKEPEKLFYGTAGTGSPLYIGVRMIEEATGAKFSHVPYKGVGPAYQDLLAGRLQFVLTDLASVRPHIDAGKLLALAVTDKTPLLPNTPTLAEAGVPGIKAFTSFSVLAPVKVPQPIVQKLAGAIAAVVKQPGNAARLEQLALLPVADTPAAFAASLKDEQQMWAAFIRQHNITAD